MTFREFILFIYRHNSIYKSLDFIKNLNIYREWRIQILSKKYPLDLELPWITIDAKNYLTKYFHKKSSKDINVFEYGAGGSSLFFSKYAKKIISIEHNPEWFKKISNVMKSKNINNWEGFLILPEPVIETKTLKPNNPEDYYSCDENFANSIFKGYSSCIDNYPDNFFDVVLIDGRSRPSCIMHSYKKVKIGGLLVVDNSEREYYYENTEKYLKNYKLVLDSYSALICTNQFTQTNIFKRTS